MRIVKVGVLAPTNKGIPLGVQGENRATEVEFDTRPWFREYPSGTVSAVARRNGDPAPYPLTLDVEDGTAVWHVSDTDTAKAGEGAVELTMTSAGARVRSLTFKTLVTASLTDAPVDDDAWYGWLDKAVVKVDETVQSAQRKMAEVDAEWTGLKADVTAKVEECGEAAAQAASDAHHAKVDAQAVAKALESADGSVAKAEAAAKRAVDAMLDADDSAVEASRSALSAGDSAEAARLSADAAANSADNAATSASNAADAASAASGSASAAAQSATDASNAKVAAQTAKAEAATSASNAATSASNAGSSATAAEKSASDAAASVNAINVIAPKSVPNSAISSAVNEVVIGMGASATGGYGIAIGQESHVTIGSVAIGSCAVADGGVGYTSLAIGDATIAHGQKSVAAGTGSIANGNNEFSIGIPQIGSGVEYTREITHVSEPTAPTSASTKKYTDDNDAKTLSEAKKYTDANTSNALVGTVSGKLLHVEDAWPGKPLGLTIEGAYKQDGTPSPENPATIVVVENPTLKVTGADTSAIGTSLPITLPAEHPYLAALPDGTHDEIVIDRYGNASLVARTQKFDINPNTTSFGEGTETGAPYIFSSLSNVAIANEYIICSNYTPSNWTNKSGFVYLTSTTEVVFRDDRFTSKEQALELLSDTVTYVSLNETSYPLGNLDIPSLPETISNVWTDAELTTNMSMAYKRDINVAFDNLVQAVVAAAAGE